MEEVLFLNNPDFKIYDSEFTYGKKCAKIVVCNGVCKRDERPLSCRIFPVIPYIKDGKFEVIFDPRAKSICPLCKLPDFSQLDKSFIKKVENTTSLLLKFRQTSLFLERLTDILDDYMKLGF